MCGETATFAIGFGEPKQPSNLMNQNSIHKIIERRLKTGNACYHVL